MHPLFTSISSLPLAMAMILPQLALLALPAWHQWAQQPPPPSSAAIRPEQKSLHGARAGQEALEKDSFVLLVRLGRDFFNFLFSVASPNMLPSFSYYCLTLVALLPPSSPPSIRPQGWQALENAARLSSHEQPLQRNWWHHVTVSPLRTGSEPRVSVEFHPIGLTNN